MFAYIYKLLYTYMYPYNHINLLLGCPGRGPGPWQPIGSPRTARYDEKMLDTHVFVCIYKLLYAYVYPYTHTNMFLGCPGRGPTHWYRFEGPRKFGNYEKWQVARNPPLSLYLCDNFVKKLVSEIRKCHQL